VVDTVLRFTGGQPGMYGGEVSVTDAPVTFDDRMHIAYRVSERLNVLLISAGNVPSDRAVAAVFGGDSTHVFTTQPYRSLDIAALDRQDLVVLNGLPDVSSGLTQALEAFVEAGGSLCIFPPAETDPAGYASVLQRFGAAVQAQPKSAQMKVERIDLEQPFYRAIFQNMPRNVDLPEVRDRWIIRPAAGSDVLLRLQDGTSYLSRSTKGRGSIFLWSSSLAEEASNLVRHALFATSLLRMAEMARPMGTLYHTIGEGYSIPLEGITIQGEQPPRLRGPDGLDVLPEVRRMQGTVSLVLHDQDLPEGTYAVTQDKDTLMLLALNHPRSESDLGAYGPDELREALAQRGLNSFTVLEGGAEDLSLRLTELDQGRKLWKWAILLALLFLAAEVFLIRLVR